MYHIVHIYCSTVHLALTTYVAIYCTSVLCFTLVLCLYQFVNASTVGLRVVCSLVYHLLCLYHFKVVHASHTFWGRCSHHFSVVFGSPLCLLQCMITYCCFNTDTYCLCPTMKAWIVIATVKFDLCSKPGFYKIMHEAYVPFGSCMKVYMPLCAFFLPT